jgi:hypothetical protein
MKRSFYGIAFLSVMCGLASAPVGAAVDCGQVTIIRMLAGTRHGSMMQVSNTSCGGAASGWICLDPDPQYTTPEKSRRQHALLLAHYLTNRPIMLSIHDGLFASACSGGYPVVEDIRTP